MKIVKWTEQAQDRLKWKAVVEKAKNLIRVVAQKQKKKKKKKKKKRKKKKRRKKKNKRRGRRRGSRRRRSGRRGGRRRRRISSYSLVHNFLLSQKEWVNIHVCLRSAVITLCIQKR
jgi:Flp pilus assembly protein TadB